MQSGTFFFILGGVWLVVLSAAFLWLFKHINSLVKESKGEPLIKTLDRLLKKEVDNEKDIKKLFGDVDGLREKGLSDIQKIGVVRFNPFSETGGDHSFSIALLDGRDTGVVLTGLHTRERTRLYIKSIVKGKSEHELSNEEKESIVRAEKGKK